VTFAVSELLLRLILSQRDITGGAKGMVMLPSLKLGDYNFSLDAKLGYYYVSLILLALSTFVLRVFVKSPTGLSVVALKDNEDYAVSRGISIARCRLAVLTISGFFTGLAGGLYAIYFRVASPDIFGFDLLTFILSMVIFGGIGTVYGSIIGAFVLVSLSELMFDWGAVRYIVIAAIILLTIILFPTGLYGIGQAAYRMVVGIGARLEQGTLLRRSTPNVMRSHND
jgi:branched-chain amino acid transport system permease protein